LKEKKNNDKNISELSMKIDSIRKKSKYGGNKKNNHINTNNFGLGMRISMEMIASLLVGGALGWFADDFFGTKPALLIFFIALGMLAGFRSVYKVIKNINHIENN
tara:strand:+ start:164 stop:478 length:315 start_codon:yes stop_codon:yes gene_type:complete